MLLRDRHWHPGIGSTDIGVGPLHGSLRRQALGVAGPDGHLRGFEECLAGLQLPRRLGEDLDIQHLLCDHGGQPLDLAVPALHERCVAPHLSLCLGDLLGGCRDIRWATTYCFLDCLTSARSSSTWACICRCCSTSSGAVSSTSVAPLFTRSPMSTFHFRTKPETFA